MTHKVAGRLVFGEDVFREQENVDREMENFVSNLEQDGEGNSFIGGKIVTPEQLNRIVDERRGWLEDRIFGRWPYRVR